MIAKFLFARLQSIGYAVRGIGTLISTQPNAQLHLVATFSVPIAGYFLHLTECEWIAILLCIALVWTAEALNTALEQLADEVDPNYRPGIGRAKDVAAAGVLIAALISTLVAGVILIHHLC
jgi:diacylglycerol kinase